MQAGDTTIIERPGPRSDEAFQKLLLRFSVAAAQGPDAASLIRQFCQATREFFQVDGAYFWHCDSSGELIGTEADGVMAERFRGTRLKASESAVAVEAVRQRKTIRANHLDPTRYRLAAEFHARSIMAAPLVVSNEVIGAAVFLHCSDPDFFSEDLAAKATILAGQLGSLLEAGRLTRVSREQHRRAQILVEVAQTLHSMTDAKAVVEAVADRLRVLLRTRLVCVMLRQGGSFALHAVAAESAQLAASARAKHDRKGLQFAADLASRAVGAGEPVAVPIDPATHALGSLVPAGMLIAAPFRTSQTEGAVLVYPRQDGAFSPEEKSVISAVAGFGSVAIANAELYSSSRAHTHELHQLLDVSSELGSIGQLDDFLQKFALRAADFLGFGRAFIGLLEEGAFRVRWSAESGATRRVELVFPEGPASRALMNREVFWTDDPSTIPGANLDVIAEFNVRQILAVPLLGTDGQVLGMFGVLDRLDGSQISHEDIRRARALAAQVAVTLEASRNLDLSERHRTRAESLMSLALELNSLLKLPDFAQSFARRAADMLGAQTAALAVKQESGLETLVLAQGIEADQHRPLFRRFSHALQAALDKHAEPIVSSTSTEILGAALGAELGGGDCTLVRLMGGSAELVGVLCLANRGKPLAAEDQQLLQAIAGHASVALENARLFTRMEQANRHWIEIFDAIGDFIVAAEGADRGKHVSAAGDGTDSACPGVPFLPEHR